MRRNFSNIAVPFNFSDEDFEIWEGLMTFSRSHSTSIHCGGYHACLGKCLSIKKRKERRKKKKEDESVCKKRHI